MLKYSFCLFFSLLTITAFAQKKKVYLFELDNFNGRYFQKNHQEPFSGVAIVEYTPGEIMSRVQFKDGKPNGKVIQYERTGKKISESTFVNGVKDGPEMQWYPNGNKKVLVNYQRGKPHGMIIEYHQNGKMLSKGEIYDGIENGKYSWWFDNGQLDQELTYEMGKVNGAVKNWYPDGTLKMVSNFRLGVKQGTTTHYYANGQMSYKKNFNNDMEVDTSVYWEKDGLLVEKKVYNNRGELIKKMDYHEASLLTKDGYVHVYNKKNSNFTVSITGQVQPVNAEVLAFLVNGKAIELFCFPKQEGVEEKVALTAQMKTDIARLEKTLDTTFTVIDEFKQLPNGNTILYWHFEVPQKEGENRITVKEELNISMVCQNHILTLHGLVLGNQSAEDILPILSKIAESIKLYDAPIDVIQYGIDLRKNK